MTPRWIALAMLSALMMASAAAQERPEAFPTRSIKIVVPFPAGGPSDVLARMIGQKMSEDWSQPVVVENRPGANTVLAAQQVAKAAPDGYTLLMAIDSTLTMNQYLYRTPPYDPFNDFAPITLTAKTMQLLIVNAASDVKTVKELIAKAKGQPGKLNYGAGTITTKLTGHLFNKAAGIDTVLVPYNGSAEVAQAVLTKSVDFSFDGPSASLSLIQSGTFRPVPARARPADHHRRGAEDGRDYGLARACCAQGHTGSHCQQAAGRSGEDLGRSRHQGKGRRLGPVPRHQHARGIFSLHP
jgi:tripartite-type tricarboxylate transporter receptor subunit TctC